MSQDIYSTIFVFIFGAIIGSFLNVVIYRVPIGRSITKPRSSCVSCGSELKWFELIPVFSYIFLKGRCRKCGIKISPRYAIVEAATGALSAGLFLRYGPTFELLMMLMLLYLLIPVFFIDIEHMIIPNGIIIIGMVSFAVAFLYSLIFRDVFLKDMLFGGLAGGGIMLIIYLIGFAVYKKEALGFGDVKLFFITGLFIGLKLTGVAFLLSIFSGALFGIFFIFVKKKDGKTEIPFGPYIVFGSVLSMFIGELLYNWYVGSFI